MRFEVTHASRFRYSRPVFLEPHQVRLCPRWDGAQRVLEFSVEVDPKPAGLSTTLDPEGNTVLEAWFTDLTDQLTITTRFSVETCRSNPFDYLLLAGGQRLPVYYGEDTGRLLQYLSPDYGATNVAALADELSQEANGDTTAFLLALNSRLYNGWEVIIREEGAPFAAEETLALKQGSCRDLSVLFIEACRSVGLAARFVSGYQQGDPVQDARYLHAWAEVYLPGGGWRGFDPTLGLAVADAHVAVAATARPADAAPLHGTFRGTGATSELVADIQLWTDGWG